MAICPADFRGCIDDLCYGGGCLKLADMTPMLEPCHGCKQLVGIDGSDPFDACECDERDRDDDDFDDEDD
jgi:hypothetical protein